MTDLTLTPAQAAEVTQTLELAEPMLAELVEFLKHLREDGDRALATAMSASLIDDRFDRGTLVSLFAAALEHLADGPQGAPQAVGVPQAIAPQWGNGGYV